ncbi:MAG: hypothetical protein AAF357_01560 [Verrucomicrobiota bacterium]
MKSHSASVALKIILVMFSAASLLTASEPAYPDSFNHLRFVPHKDVVDEDKICFVLYTTHDDIMKMVVQFYPLDEGDSRTAHLEVQEDGQWKRIATETIRENDYGIYDEKAWNLRFRVEEWDMSQDFSYRVVALDGVATYEGLIRKDPVEKNEIVVAAFSCNSWKDLHTRQDVVDTVNIQDPDLLFFAGDQIYHHTHHLGEWLIFGEQFGELTRNRPTVAIPDDHDAGQGNLWGSSGKKPEHKKAHDGGYIQRPQYVNEVQFAQSGNLPDPYDPTPVQQGIGVYYTSLKVGGIDFAIIEDRKFKNGPLEIFPELANQERADTPQGVSGEDLHSEEAVLLGERQLAFLRDWGKQWDGVEMKTVLSQTIFAQAQSKGADLDSNGWPSAGRNRALREMRKSFAFHLAGDQHLATVIHHGIDEFGDAGYSYCVPAVVNHFPRRWSPGKNFPPVRTIDGPLKHLGDYFDNFKNRITMYAHANPGAFSPPIHVGNDRARMATGHGLVRFNKAERSITMECWPRGMGPGTEDARQYPGWPITISQLDNYGKQATTHLPELKIVGETDPVVQVIEESADEVVYTLRIKGNRFRPKVFASGAYTIHIGEGADRQTLSGVETLDRGGKKSIDVQR